MPHLTSESGGFAHHNEESARIQSLLPLYLRETAAFSAESNAAGKETSLIALLEEYYKFVNSPGMVLSVELIDERSDSTFTLPETNVSTGHDGHGHGLTVNFEVGSNSPDFGRIIDVTINNPGQDYRINDLVRITDAEGVSVAELRIADVVSGPSDVINRILPEHDLNTVSEDYINEFQKEVAIIAPTSNLARISKKELFKKILVYYNTRGSEDSIHAFFRIFFDTDVTLFYPKHYIFKPSAATFDTADYNPKFTDVVLPSDLTLVDRDVTAGGLTSGDVIAGNTRVDLDPNGDIIVDITGGGNTSVEFNNYSIPPSQTRLRLPGLRGYTDVIIGDYVGYTGAFPGDGPYGMRMDQFEAAFEPCNIFFASEGTSQPFTNAKLRSTASVPGWACPGSSDWGGVNVIYKDPDTNRWYVGLGVGAIKQDSVFSDFNRPNASTTAAYPDDLTGGTHHSLPDVVIPYSNQNKTYSSIQNLQQPLLIHTVGAYPDSAFPPLEATAWSNLIETIDVGFEYVAVGNMSRNLVIESVHNPGVSFDVNGTYAHSTADDGSDIYLNVNNTNIQLAQVGGRWSIIDISPEPPESIEITKNLTYRYVDDLNHPYSTPDDFSNGQANESWLKGTWTKQSGGAKFSFVRQKESQSDSRHQVSQQIADSANPGFAHVNAVISPAIVSDFGDNFNSAGSYDAKLVTSYGGVSELGPQIAHEDTNFGGVFRPAINYRASDIPDLGIDGWYSEYLSEGYQRWEIDWQASEWTHTAPAGQPNSYGEYLGSSSYSGAQHPMYFLYDPNGDGIQDDDSEIYNFITIAQKFSILRLIGSAYNVKPANMWVIYDHWRNTVIAHTLPNEIDNTVRNDKLYPPKTGWVGTGRGSTSKNTYFGLGDPRESQGNSYLTENLGTVLTYSETPLSIADGRVLYQDKESTSTYSTIVEYVAAEVALEFESVQDSTIQDPVTKSNLVLPGAAIRSIALPAFNDQLESSTPTAIPEPGYKLDHKFYIHDYSPALNVELFDDSPLQPDKIVYVVDGFTNNRSVLNGTYEFYDQEGDGSPNFPQRVTYRHSSSHNSPKALEPVSSFVTQYLGGRASEDSPLYQLELVMDSNDGGGAILKTTRELDSPNGPTFFSNLSTIGDGTDLRPGQKPAFEGTVSVQPRYIGVPAKINFYDEPGGDGGLYEERAGRGQGFYPTKITQSDNMFLKPGHIYGSNKPNFMSIVEQDSSPVRVGPTQHLIMPFTAAGKAFTSVSINDGHQHIFTFATEKSTIDFFDNSPVSSTPTDSITLKAGESHTFISRINSNKHATSGVGSENFPGTVYVRSTGNILASTATFEKQDSPKASIEAPKAMAILHPTTTNSYIKNPINSPDASPSNIIAVDQYLNTNFNSPGLLNRTDFTISDAIFADQSPPEAENTFLGSFIKAGNSPHGDVDSTGSPTLGTDNSSPNAKMAIFSINDGFGDDMTAGMSLTEMRDNYVYGDKLTDYSIITPYNNTITVKYKLPKDVLIINDSPAKFNGYQLNNFLIINDDYASPSRVNAFYTETNSNRFDEPSGKFMILRRKPGTYRVATPDLGTKNGQWSIMRIDDSSPGRRAVYFVDENIISQTDDLTKVNFVPAANSEKRIPTHGFSSQVGEVFKAESDRPLERIKTIYEEYTYKTHTLSASEDSPNGVQVYGPVSSIDASPDAGARDPIRVPDSPRGLVGSVPSLWRFTARRPFMLTINKNGNEEVITGGQNINQYNVLKFDSTLQGLTNQAPKKASIAKAVAKAVGADDNQLLPVTEVTVTGGTSVGFGYNAITGVYRYNETERKWFNITKRGVRRTDQFSYQGKDFVDMAPFFHFNRDINRWQFYIATSFKDQRPGGPWHDNDVNQTNFPVTHVPGSRFSNILLYFMRTGNNGYILSDNTGLTEEEGFWNNPGGGATGAKGVGGSGYPGDWVDAHLVGTDPGDGQPFFNTPAPHPDFGNNMTIHETIGKIYGLTGVKFEVSRRLILGADSGRVEDLQNYFNPSSVDDGSTGIGGSATNSAGEATFGGNYLSGGGSKLGISESTRELFRPRQTNPSVPVEYVITREYDDGVTLGIRQAIKYNQSMLSHELKLQDLQYYSDYSYEIRSKLDMSTWGAAFENFAHPAGLKFYGKLMDSPNDSPF